MIIFRATKDLSIALSADNSVWEEVVSHVLADTRNVGPMAVPETFTIGRCARYVKLVLRSGYGVGMGLGKVEIFTDPAVLADNTEVCA